MLLSIFISALFTIAALAAALSLRDSWVRLCLLYSALKSERALLDAGFVPQVAAQSMRLRSEPYRRHFAQRAATRDATGKAAGGSIRDAG
ncbi:MAG: hypothetical protein QNI87_01530 [Erythrobacter sp.]|uniref:hypothetical protein n=1 Tax=Erythrobacter sp. TaxID=1042 RepID=UPI0026286876|nr:hypothetical protein [Erythrobacter sp.]MDJ0977196.1 hypothetical protein [Erythrobacter sp.]